MRFFLLYLKQKRIFLLGFALSVGIFALTFALYDLPRGAVLYPALLCAALWLRLALAVILCAKKKLETFSLIAERAEALNESMLPAAKTFDDEDYGKLIALLIELRESMRGRMQADFADTLDYFTVWAHQIKTPIAAMRLKLQSEDSPLSRRLRGELARVEQYVEMAMVFLRLDTDSTDYVFRETDLDALVRGAVRRFSAEFIDRRLRLEYEGTDAKVLTDEKWLCFVLEQILSNALKYTPEGTISIYVEGEKTLCVADTGIGIAPEDLPRIFEKGYTGQVGRQDKTASGLGLYLCRRICTALGHGIGAQSEPGKGTVIKLDLAKGAMVYE